MSNTKSKDYYMGYSGLDLSHLEKWEKELIDIFNEATKICGKIYLKQKNSEKPGANFYPVDSTKEEIEAASKDNQDILDPYTIVKRDADGKLITVKYSKEFHEEIAQIVELLQKAVPIYLSNGYDLYAKYITQLGEDLKSDRYEKSERMWLRFQSKTNADIPLGPTETYQHQPLGVTMAFQSPLRLTALL